MKYYRPPNKLLWQGRKDSLPNERYFQMIHCADLTKNKIHAQKKKTIAIVGFCCDEGIKRNLGRTGARKGPELLRKTLANLAVHCSDNLYLYDIGDIVCEDEDLETAQMELAEIVNGLLAKNIFPVIFGGGHEVAWGHYQGIYSAKPTINIGIINIDAHFDLRPLLANNQGTSGTAFKQIALDRKKNNLAFNYLCLGIQPSANTKSLFSVANELKVDYIVAEAFHENKIKFITDTIIHFLDRVDAIYLSLCLDVFSQSFAPGVSAPQINGLLIAQVIPFLKLITKSNKMISFDIAELSPELDQNNLTANLAAYLVAKIFEEFDYFR